MCGIVGVIHGDSSASSGAAADLYNALIRLQHRGQDACGIATCGAGGRIFQNKGNGLASRVFREGERVADLPGFMGIGHNRYPTAGSSANAEAQPLFVNSPYGICMSHNGNLINAPELKRYLDMEAHRHINTNSDSELMLNIYASELNETGKARVNTEDCFAALSRTYQKCKGAWACTAMVAGFGLIGFRDRHGIRPLVLGKRKISDHENDYMFASESTALRAFGCAAEDIMDILPGQAVIIEKGKSPEFKQVQEQVTYAPDLFEYLYFARPDSKMDGIGVNESRKRMGIKLADTIRRTLGPELVAAIDAVVHVPETSKSSARSVAMALGKESADGFVKNTYVGRTFIMPNQKVRLTGVRRKLSAIDEEFAGRNVLLIDDSIVRGTTSIEIVQMAREAGAKSVYLASCAPPITHPHIYGIDLASIHELIAHRRSGEEIAREIGADAVIYQELDDLVAAVAELSPRPNQKFEVGVFCGKYITPVDDGYFEHLEQIRGQNKRRAVKAAARQALANGLAEDVQLQLAANGTDIDTNGKTVPSGIDQTRAASAYTEGKSGQMQHGEEHNEQRTTQDISLDNLNDHER